MTSLSGVTGTRDQQSLESSQSDWSKKVLETVLVSTGQTSAHFRRKVKLSDENPTKTVSSNLYGVKKV